MDHFIATTLQPSSNTMRHYTITIIVDDPKSWIIPYAKELKKNLQSKGHNVYLVQEHTQIRPGDMAFFLGCTSIIKRKILSRNKHNLVVHESALPEGKGWSPLTWQIVEGKNEIPITLFEAVEEVDAGPIYFQEIMSFAGHELLDELHAVQGEKTIELCLKFVDQYPNVQARPQQGKESFYRKRTKSDSRLDPHKSIIESFNMFRVADNKRYPVFFEYLGHEYILKIEKAK